MGPVARRPSSSPKRFLATSSALRLASSSCLRRSSSSRLRASAASRSVFSVTSREARRRASSSAIRRSSASRTRLSASAWARAVRSSSVKVRSTTPEGLGDSPAGAGVAAVRGATPRFLGASAGAGSAFTSVGAPMTRRLTFSTTTCLLRPWLKLWRTTPVSVRGLSVSLPPPTLSLVSPGFFVSLIPNFVLMRRPPTQMRWSQRLDGENASNAQCARETSRSRARQAGLHVPHLGGAMPNPIVRRKICR